MTTRLLGAVLVLGFLVGGLVAHLLTREPNSATGLPPEEPTTTVTTTSEAPTGPLARLSTAEVPSLCGHPAGRLVDGSLPGLPPDMGHVALLSPRSPDKTEAIIATGDLTGDARPDTAAVFSCNQGGVSWPHWVVLHDERLRVLGAVDLGALTTSGRGVVTRLAIDDQRVTMDWSTHEGAGACERTWTASIRVAGGEAGVEGQEQVGGAGPDCTP